MAVLIFQENGNQKEFQLAESHNPQAPDIRIESTGKSDGVSSTGPTETGIRIGSANDNDIIFSPDFSLRPLHAVLVRSSGSWVLIDKSNGDTLVNNEKVTMLKVLEHCDKIKVGKKDMEFHEIKKQTLAKDSILIGNTCPICIKKSREGDEVIPCPRCATLYHRDCWFSIEKCTCGYLPVPCERLDSYSSLVNRECSCGRIFKRGDTALYCPQCQTPYHDNCWFEIKKCKTCGFVREKEEREEQ